MRVEICLTVSHLPRADVRQAKAVTFCHFSYTHTRNLNTHLQIPAHIRKCLANLHTDLQIILLQ